MFSPRALNTYIPPLQILQRHNYLFFGSLHLPACLHHTIVRTGKILPAEFFLLLHCPAAIIAKGFLAGIDAKAVSPPG